MFHLCLLYFSERLSSAVVITFDIPTQQRPQVLQQESDTKLIVTCLAWRDLIVRLSFTAARCTPPPCRGQLSHSDWLPLNTYRV